MQCPRCTSYVADDAIQCGVCGAPIKPAISIPDPTSAPEPAPEAGEEPTGSPDDLRQSPITTLLGIAWTAFKSKPELLIGLFFVFFILSYITGKIFNTISPPQDHAYGIGNLIVLALLFVFQAGYYWVCLKVVRNEQASFNDFFIGFSSWPRLLHLLLGYILWALLLGLGWFLLVIPFFIFFVGFQQWVFLVLEEETSAVMALKGSWRMMRGYKLTAFLLWLTLGALNLLGLLALGIGLVITLPVSIITLAAFYDRLKKINPPVLD